MKKLLLFVIACTLGLFGTVSAQETSFYDDFEDASTLETNWNLFQGEDADGANWQRGDGALCGGYQDSYAVYSASYTTSNVQCDNYIMTKNAYLISESSEIQWYVTHSAYNYAASDGYYVTISEDGVEFVHASGELTCKSGEPEQSFSLAAYAGKTIYVGFHHTGWGGEYLKIDNIRLTAGEGGGEEPEQPEAEPISEFFFDFNDGSMTGLRVFKDSLSQAVNWQVSADGDTYYSGHENTRAIYSCSWDNNFVWPYNYVVTVNPCTITATSELSWYMRYTYTSGAENDKYQVVASTDGVDFNIVLWTGTAASANENTLSLAEYAGQTLYLGFYHYTEASPGDAIVLDNIKLTAGEGGGEEPEPDPTPVAPAAPVVTATATETTVTLTWDAVENATYYNIYTPNNYAGSNVLGLEATTYTFEGLTAGTEYCFEVSAVNDVDESETTEACATTTTPVDPADLCTVIFTLKDSYGDGWNGNYLLVEYNGVSEQIDFVGSGTSYKEKVATLELPQGANAKVTYTVPYTNTYPSENSFVVAYESGKEIINSPQGAILTTTSFEFNVNCIPTAPEKPVVVATPTGGSTIVLAFTAADADTYTIYNGTEVVATGVTETTYTVEGLTAATEYCFTVVATNEIGDSEVSEAACATTYAEGTVIVSVGEGDIAQMSAPIYNAGPTTSPVYSLSQQIYTAAEIGLEGNATVHSISFQHATGNNNTRDIVVYLKNTDKGLFEGNYDWIEFSDSDKVYEGTFTFGKAEDWVTIEFQNAFEYTGGNLAVIVYDKTGTAYGYTYDICDKFYSSQVNEWRGSYVTKTAEMDFSALGTYYATSMNTGNWGTPANAYYINNIKLRTLAVPAGPVIADYRLESVEGWGVTEYIYDEEETNTVVGVIEDEVLAEVTYNEAGQIASALAYAEDVDEEGNPVKEVVSGVEYTYDENGVWTSYTETLRSWFGGVYSATTELAYNEAGQLVSLTSEEYARTIAYNEAGLISEVIEGYISLGGEEIEPDGGEEGEDNGIAPLSVEIDIEGKITFEYDEQGRLVKKEYYGYDAYETMDFYLNESEAYEYDENGNCVAKRAYLVVEDEEGNFVLNSFPYSVTEYFYDLTIENEDVYSFEYPHFAFINYVEPSYTNILLKEYSFMSYYDEDLDEVVSHSYDVVVYNYNPEVLSAPLAPMNLTAEILSASSADLAWAGFADAESFIIYCNDTVYATNVEDAYYEVENLEMGVEYTFSVVAVNAVDTSAHSNAVVVKIELPAAPANLVAEATSVSTIDLTWDKVEGIYTYNVYKVVEVEGETTYELVEEEVWGTEYTVEGLEAETEYSFVVKSVNEVGESEASNVATAKTLVAAPAAPVLVAEATSDTTIVLTWEAVEGATNYNIYSADTLVANVTELTYTVTGLTAETEYSFTVKAVNEAGESEASNVATATTLKAEEDEPVVPEPTAPAAPANLAAEATSDTTIVLTWEAVEGALSYNVYQGADSIANVTDTTYTVTGLTANTEYTFTVKAVNEVGESEASNEAKAKTLEATPEEPGEGIAENAAAFNIYPNPASDRVVIETEATIEEVTIYTITGVMVYSEVDFNDNTINVSDFANGVYVMKVRTDNGESFQRFIKK